MNGTAVRPACIVISILMVILASLGFAPSARGQAPDPGAISPVPTPDVPTLPAKPGEGGLTIALLMLALLGATAVAAELSELKQRREAERV